MALNKLKTGVALSTQIAEQNANLTEIEKSLEVGVWKPVTLNAGIEQLQTVEYLDTKDVIYIRGRIRGVPAGSSDIGTLGASVLRTQSCMGMVLTDPIAVCQVVVSTRTLTLHKVPASYSFIQLDGIVFSKL